MKRIIVFMVAVFVLTAAVAHPRDIPQARATTTTELTPSDGVLYVSETGQYLHGTFRVYYETHGGVEIFGLPVTPIISVGGLRVQYFERARFEVPVGHDEQNTVTLGRLGAAAVEALDAEARANPPFAGIVESAIPAGAQYFSATQHSLKGDFANFWQANGGLAVFGYPLSEEFYQEIDGVVLRVQYFERARMEARLVDNGVRITLGLLGREYLATQPQLQPLMAPMPGLQRVASATTSYRGAGWAKRTNIARAGAMIDGTIIPAGGEFSFLQSSNFIDTDFVEGYGIIGGQLSTVIGGGICQVSTTVFRSASNGGFPITERVPHTYVVTTYEDIPGFDAAVMSPSVDFRFVNDSAALLMLVVRNEPEQLRFTVELWGVPDGRTVQYAGPYISNVTRPYTPIWQYDASLPRGATRQLVVGRGGMRVSYQRTVLAADGQVLRQDDYRTSYAPWYDYVLYGPGVTPPAGVRTR